MAKVTQQISTTMGVSDAIAAFKELHSDKVYSEQLGPANEVLLKPVYGPLAFLVPSVRQVVIFEKNGAALSCCAQANSNNYLLVIALVVVYLLIFPVSILLVIPVILSDLKISKHFKQLIADFKARLEAPIEVKSQTQGSQINKYDRLEKLAALKEKGHLSEEEFQQEKKKLFES